MKFKALIGTSILAMAVATPAWAQDAADEVERDAFGGEIVVTAQRQSERLQDVPIAVSAFSAEALEAQQIENASDLQLTLPNVTFSKGNFTGSSFTIRGIGDLCVGFSCDSATAIHVNGSPLFGTRLFETEYFDLERIEVLRGPQGTLFGRNATSGVVNFVTAKPKPSQFEASADGEYGNFNAWKVKGMVNVPLGDTLAFRAAGFYLKRDGYTTNLFDDSSIDGREMYAVRGSLRWEPTPDTTLDLMGYYFREKDDRLRIQKQLCQRDPTGVLGCLNNRRDYGKTNGNSTFPSVLGSREVFALNGIPPALGLGTGSLYGPDNNFGSVEPTDVRTVNTDFTPEYFTDEIQAQAHLEHNFGNVSVGLTGIYQRTRVDSRQDYNLDVVNRASIQPGLNSLAFLAANGIPTGLPAPAPAFVPGSAAYFAPIAAALIPDGPSGRVCTSNTNPNGLGAFGGDSICGTSPLAFDRSVAKNESWASEAIIASDFDSPFNFLLGGIYSESVTTDGDYYVNAFPIDYFAALFGTFSALGAGAPPSFLGSPYFKNHDERFKLTSYGIFGEAYFEASDRLKLTVGLRYNNDKKHDISNSTLANFLVPYGTTGDIFNSPFAGGYDADTGATGLPGPQKFRDRTVKFDEFTGRAVIDFKLTDDNLLYASYSRGYKSGGINPALQVIIPGVTESFDSEIVDSFEIGSKNTFGNGALQLNLTGFYYKYKGLQLSRIVARTSLNDNIDADIYGFEAEGIIRPDPDWLINLGFSYLHTKVTDDTLFINQRDPSGGLPNSVIIKDISQAFNCAVVANVGGQATADGFVTAVNNGINATRGLTAANGLRGPTAFPSDANLGAATGAFSSCAALETAAAGTGGAITVYGGGVPISIKGNKLPQAPNVKFSAGVQHTVNFSGGMSLVPRLDLTYTGDSYGNIFNGRVNKVKGYAQANAQIQLNGADDRWYVRAFVQNIFDSNATTGLYLTDQSSGLFTNIFTLDPRRYGLGAGVKF
ncbi:MULTISPECIES: TonB-dependent receptor domain-containing protein [unclassified Sphingopyxis]|uniref:TonB-dependent receptor domain-containing protein n=1 Tax=unclassified Sphingopyxis TaxID=2614943 RepID=UPI0028587397|nr:MULTISPECIES: TonB-dependent receptor [unclassified Sphingopyxis]MDR6832355.1 outer membrane receptor protein involved in Fe transport [Sphingopyxis sp. BE122]MDR7228098.1 outer membrane receptor protein involved in Fe transport [Sphingopyxis sp. BE259]